MDDRPDLGVPAQTPLQQTQQASNTQKPANPSTSQPPTSNPTNTPQQVVEPVKKQMPWWVWVIISVSVTAIIGAAVYFFFLRAA